MQITLQEELDRALAKRDELLLCGANDEELNDKIKELRFKIEKYG